MKILHVIRDLSIATGGPVAALSGLTEAQARLGHDVTILATDRGEAKVEPKDVHRHMVPSRLGEWAWSPVIRDRLERLLPAADIVHLHMVWDYPVWAAARSAVRHGKPFILRPCGQLDPWSLSQKVLKKRVYLMLCGTQLRKASAIHFTTEGERDGALRVIGNTRSFVIPIGVRENAYRDLPPRTAFAQRFHQLTGRRIVLFLGRLHPKKQPDVVIRAFYQAYRYAADTCLVLAGPSSPDYLRYLQRLANDLRIEDRVIFTGILRGPAVQEAYRSAALFVLPSLQENFGVAVAEAMAAGCPVVVSDQVDLSPDIRQAEAGLVATPTVEAVAGAVALLLRDEPLRRRMGESGRRLVLERFTWEKVAPDVVQVYEDILLGRRLGPAWRIPDRVWEAGPDSSDN